MSATLIYLPQARNDVEGIYLAYEREREGLGERFLARLADCEDRLRYFPEVYGKVHEEVRAATLKRFPHIIYYRYEAETVFILAVVHGARDSDAWKRRI